MPNKKNKIDAYVDACLSVGEIEKTILEAKAEQSRLYILASALWDEMTENEQEKATEAYYERVTADE